MGFPDDAGDPGGLGHGWSGAGRVVGRTAPVRYDPEGSKTDCFHSQGGTQWHLLDEHGFSWCGLRPEQIYMRQSRIWGQTPDPERCQSCRRLAPFPTFLVRKMRGRRVLAERVVTHLERRKAR